MMYGKLTKCLLVALYYYNDDKNDKEIKDD